MDNLQRDSSFYQSIIDVFAHNDIHYPVDLVGADISSMEVPTPHGTDEGEVVVLSTGKKSFIFRHVICDPGVEVRSPLLVRLPASSASWSPVCRPSAR